MKIFNVCLLAIPYILSTSLQAGDYDVSGYSDDGSYVYGEIDSSSGSRYVDGYIYTEEGESKYFDGEWSGYGKIEGYDEDGNYISLDVD
jgi:hypothetical protein|tara:strand:+ start:227 stop:493 length:267 start_codon:yes stop_codon:yes gene_type:complete